MRATQSASESAYWILRIGAALCFIGHGAFGFITKAAWLPYFGVMGIPERWAWKLMPIVGAVDVTAGMAVLFAPRGLPLVYMSVWALFTALLRPLAGESVLEAFERAGNYGVPMALLAMTSIPTSVRALIDRREMPSIDATMIERVSAILKWTTVLLLGAHGLIGVAGKATLATHYGTLGLPSGTTPIVGWCEVALSAVIAVRPVPGLLMFVAAWKIATESLFIISGAPVWEVVERAGSFAAPLALAALTYRSHQIRRIASANRLRTSDSVVARSLL
ncbi:MAG: hypothetical protein ABI625_12205 [bacterium]